MPRTCKVPGCSYKRDKDSSRGLHLLPKTMKETVRRQILKDLGFPEDFEIKSQHFHICSAHFTDGSFACNKKKNLLDEPKVVGVQEKEEGALDEENEIELDGKLYKSKIKFYCQFCLSRQSKHSSKIDLNKDDLRKSFFEFTGKELDTLKFSEFICCDPCFQMFLNATEYRHKLLRNQRILNDLFNSESSETFFNKSELDSFENFEIKKEEFEDVVIKEEEVVTPQCFTCHEVLGEHHSCLPIPKIKKAKENVQKIIYSEKTTKDPITCDGCNKKFVKRTSFAIHFRNYHIHSAQVICHQCGKLVNNQRQLRIHMHTHSEKKFICDQCPKTFKYTANLKRHKMTHSSVKPFSCPICQRGYTQKVTMMLHLKSFHNQKFKCDGCEKTYNDKRLLEKHVRRHVKRDPRAKNKVYDCIVQDCTYQSQWRHAIGVHLDKVHDMTFDHFERTCLECFHVSDNPGTHVIHMKTHSCKFVCEFCRQSFKTDQILQSHVAKYHSRLDEDRPFVCDFPECGAKFKRAAHLQSHRTFRHLTEKKFACSHCDMTFHFHHGFIVHMRIHTDSKPYQCWICDFKCRASSGLQTHMKLSHRESRIYSCKYCSKKFELHLQLTQHEKKKH